MLKELMDSQINQKLYRTIYRGIMPSTLLVNVQKFAIHDGAGIRTTVFFKGCPLNCAWCHNPESQSFQKQTMVYLHRCVGCGACVTACENQCISIDTCGVQQMDKFKCISCGKCVNFCIYNAREIIGTQIDASSLARQLKRDHVFYETSEGGVTLSGGEVMAQDSEFLLSLLKNLKQWDCNVIIDTCGYAPFEKYKQILAYVDIFLFDLKLMDSDKHLQYTGKSNQLILQNLVRLSESSARIQLRIPLLSGINDTQEETDAMISFIKKNVHIETVSLLPYHTIGSHKYGYLGMQIPIFAPPSDTHIQKIKQAWQNAGYSVEIGG